MLDGVRPGVHDTIHSGSKSAWTPLDTQERSGNIGVQEKRQPQTILDKIARRAVFLLKESEDPQAEMNWAENRLLEADLLNWSPRRTPPQAWAEQAIAQNPDLMDQSVPWLKERDSHPEKAETFESLILKPNPKRRRPVRETPTSANTPGHLTSTN